MRDERLRNPIALAENIMKIDLMRSKEELVDLQNELLHKFKENIAKQFTIREDLKNLILNLNNLYNPTNATLEVVKHVYN